MTIHSLAIRSFARSERRSEPPRSWRIVLFTASLWMGGVLFLYVGSEEAPSESYVMLLFGAGLSRFGSALAARARQMK